VSDRYRRKLPQDRGNLKPVCTLIDSAAPGASSVRHRARTAA